MLEKKSRVLLTISGIIIGIFTFTFFIFVSQGLTNAITEQFSSFGVNVLVVSPASSGANGPPSGQGLTDTDIARIQQVISDYNYIAPVIFNSDLYEFSREKSVIVTLAYPDEYWDEVSEDLGIEIEEGRMLRPGDTGVAVIGAKTSKDSFQDKTVKVGNSIKTSDGRSLRVIGIIKERGDLFVDGAMLISFDDMKEISGQDTYTGIRISFQEGADLTAMQKAIERKLNPNGEEERIQVSSPDQAIEQVSSILGVLTLIISFVSSVALLVGGINVLNTMYSNVLERINEISVMKALGATNKDLIQLFLIESSLLGFTGALVGFFMAYGLAELVSYGVTNGLNYNVPVYFDLGFFIGVMVVTILFAILFGTYPAVKAAQVDPADNLRDE